MPPKIIDLFCCSGGAGVGYHRGDPAGLHRMGWHGTDEGIAVVKCVDPPIGCGQDVTYRIGGWDELTIREFNISKLCDRCQDFVFAEPEEDGDWESDPGFDWDKMTSLSQYQQEEDFLKGA